MCSAICADRQALEIELQAARQHRHRQLLRIGGREQELHVRRRLLERLQQRVEGVRREHVHFVDEVHLVAAAGRRVLHVVEQLARVVDLGARGGVDLDEVDEAAGVDLAAGGADAAGLGADARVSQFRHLAKMRAIVVLPTPRVPVNRNAWCTRPAVERIDQRAHARAPGRPARRTSSGATCAPARCSSCTVLEAARTGGGPHQLELRHPTSPLPLLPSGPDGIHDWSSRRSRCGPP